MLAFLLGVVLVIGGAIIGTVGFNATSALIIGGSSNQWTHIYGANKATSNDFNNLVAVIKTGADVKIQFANQIVYCSALEASSEGVQVKQPINFPLHFKV